jgi:hypothetical protein
MVGHACEPGDAAGDGPEPIGGLPRTRSGRVRVHPLVKVDEVIGPDVAAVLAGPGVHRSTMKAQGVAFGKGVERVAAHVEPPARPLEGPRNRSEWGLREDG